MQKLYGIGIFWLIANAIASQLSPAAARVVSSIVAVVVFAGLGSIALSAVRGGDGFDHLVEGFSLAISGWALTTKVFNWSLVNPDRFCDAIRPCGAGAIAEAMVLNLAIVGAGMAIVSVPGVPLISAIWNLRHEKLIRPPSTHDHS